MRITNNTICKNCGHTKSCHRGMTDSQCLYVNHSCAVPTQENICGCKNFEGCSE